MPDPLNIILYAVLPYVALALFVIITIRRYRGHPFGFTSRSSQFIENRSHFWGMVPFHYGILLVLSGHLVAFLLPDTVLTWNSVPWRLYLLEVSGYLLAVLSLFGLIVLGVRRIRGTKLLPFTGTMDWLVFGLLFIQIATGIWIAVGYRWGSSWFAISMTPYLRSLLVLQPDINLVAGYPYVVKLHLVTAFVLIGIFPFTRLVHVLVAPVPYLWRRTQVVRWHQEHSQKSLVNND